VQGSVEQFDGILEAGMVDAEDVRDYYREAVLEWEAVREDPERRRQEWWGTAGWRLRAGLDDQESSIYIGFADSGFRISNKGRRARDGRRVGARAAEAGVSEDRFAFGQIVTPPCLIWCPIGTCGSLNQVRWPMELVG